MVKVCQPVPNEGVSGKIWSREGKSLPKKCKKGFDFRYSTLLVIQQKRAQRENDRIAPVRSSTLSTMFYLSVVNLLDEASRAGRGSWPGMSPPALNGRSAVVLYTIPSARLAPVKVRVHRILFHGCPRSKRDLYQRCTQRSFFFTPTNFVFCEIKKRKLNSMSNPLAFSGSTYITNISVKTLHVCVIVIFFGNPSFKEPRQAETFRSKCATPVVGRLLFLSELPKEVN